MSSKFMFKYVGEVNSQFGTSITSIGDTDDDGYEGIVE